LIAAGNSSLRRPPPKQVRPGVDKNPCRPVRRALKWNFHLDARLGASMHLLKGVICVLQVNTQCPFGNSRIAEVEPVHSKIPDHAPAAPPRAPAPVRIKTGRSELDNSRVHSTLPAPFAHVPNIGGIAVEIAEDGLNRAQLANLTRAHDLPRADPLRMRANHERLADMQPRPVATSINVRHSAYAQPIGFSAQPNVLRPPPREIDHGTMPDGWQRIVYR